MTAFHSAVNRIPVLREGTLKLAKMGTLSLDLFGEHAPIGQDRLHTDRLTGTLDLEMIVRTPLVYGEQTSQSDGSYPEVRLPRDAANNPIMPPTMIKGMLSRAYELLTTSRFRVFGDTSRRQRQERTIRGHREPLTYRADPAQANSLLPGRVSVSENGKWQVELLTGKGRNFRAARVRDELSAGAGKLVTAAGERLAGESREARSRLAEFRRATAHGVEIDVIVSTWEDRRGGRKNLVTHVWNKELNDYEQFFLVIGESVQTFFATGYTCRTAPPGSTASQLFQSKLYERFFFSNSTQPQFLELGEEQVERYNQVIQSYLDCHAAPGGKRHRLNRAAHRASPKAPPSQLTSGDLVFVQLNDPEFYPERGRILPHISVADVLPTMVGRRPYRLTPAEIAEHQQVQPLQSRAQASAADRLFGFVIPEVGAGEGSAVGGDVAAQGRLTFGPVKILPPPGAEHADCQQEQILVPLMSPKTTSARRFLTDRKGATPLENGNPLARRKYFGDGQLLGAAAYPVHRSILDLEDFPTTAVTLTESLGADRDNPKTRLKVHDWLQTGTVLTCRVLFTDISPDELAALLWLLDPKNLVPPKENKNQLGFLRLGIGKPLGLGAVEVRLAPNGLQLEDSQDLIQQYLNLSGCLGTARQVANPLDHSLPNEAGLRTSPWVRALQRAAFGYSDDLPVRYMSLPENRANNQTDSRTGEPKPGRGISPADLF
ncbi:hypothetical protein [Buchananella hordeovulneris]|uniref:hypothetical protein n=1 Tax=Buchananella hordeovulneris TaxID=52770 RepID=UPI000F5E9D12|nr:hypothetical protein [Buchananella hordeovulneris]RRD42428.1 hypothetical protein EII13_09590 [Buchananella hordeovulneris]